MEEIGKFIIRKAEVSDGPAILELLTKNLALVTVEEPILKLPSIVW